MVAASFSREVFRAAERVWQACSKAVTWDIMASMASFTAESVS